MTQRHPYRRRLIGDQGRAWMRDAANACGLLIVLTITWVMLYHLPAVRAFLEAAFETIQAVAVM